MPQPFVWFGHAHVTALALTFLLPGLIAFTIQPSQRPQWDRAFRLTLAVMLTANWFGWMELLYHRHWLNIGNALPLNLCDWATMATVISLFWPNQRSYELGYFWALGGTLQGMLTPDVTLDFPDIQFLLFFFFHGGIIVGVLYLTIGLKLRPYPQSLPRVAAWSFLYMGVAGLFDWFSGANYGLLHQKPNYPTVLDLMPPWPWYIGVLVLMGFASMALYYAPFFLMDYLGNRQPRHTQPKGST